MLCNSQSVLGVVLMRCTHRSFLAPTGTCIRRPWALETDCAEARRWVGTWVVP